MKLTDAVENILFNENTKKLSENKTYAERGAGRIHYFGGIMLRAIHDLLVSAGWDGGLGDCLNEWSLLLVPTRGLSYQ